MDRFGGELGYRTAELPLPSGILISLVVIYVDELKSSSVNSAVIELSQCQVKLASSNTKWTCF